MFSLHVVVSMHFTVAGIGGGNLTYTLPCYRHSWTPLSNRPKEPLESGTSHGSLELPRMRWIDIYESRACVEDEKL